MFSSMIPSSSYCLALALMCLCSQSHQSLAFQQPATLSTIRRPLSPNAAGLHITRAHSQDEDDASHNEVSRRDILKRSLYGIGLGLSVSLSGAERGNAFEFPNILISADGESRGVKGMPVPSKKLGGLSNKIRSVSKVMVRE